MKQIYANNCTTLLLGRQGENLARQVAFDVQDLADLYGPGTVELIYQRPGDEQPYPIAVERDGNTILWTVNSADTATANKYGRCELRYYVGDILAKSKIWRTLVEPAMDTPSEEAPPEPQKGWVDQVLSARAGAMQAAEKAEDALTKAPKIGDNGNWYIWDATQGTYVDTGRYAGGIVPYIGVNGNWFIGTEDSGVSATGPRGPAGRDGVDGAPGRDGISGEKGDPFRYEDFTQEQLEALRGPEGPAGQDGRDGADGKDGYTPQKGVDYFDGKDGLPGNDGVTPTIGENGNWYIGETDTGYPSRGENGQDGQPGEKGDPFTYDDYTPEQLDALRGPKGDPGPAGSDANVTAENIEAALGYLPTDKGVFVCQFDVTTFDEVSQALADGSLPVLKRGNQLYIYNETYGGNIHIFLTHYSAYSGSSRCQVSKSNTWFYSSMNTIIDSAADSMISGRNNKSFAITTVNYDYAVKTAMCDGKGAAWTDAERLAALLRMGCTVDDGGIVHWTAQ